MSNKATKQELYHLAKIHGFENRTGKKLINTEPKDWEKFLKQCYNTEGKAADSETTNDGRFIRITRKDGTVIILDRLYKGEQNDKPKREKAKVQKEKQEKKAPRPKCEISGFQKGTKKYAAFICFARGASIPRSTKAISKKFGEIKESSVKSWFSKFNKLWPSGVELLTK